MKKLLLSIIACGPLFGQNIVGTWQGTLQVPSRDWRTVFKISTTDADALKAVLYSIDQGGQPISANTVTREGSSIKISILGIGGTYEGKLTADGNSITGTWSQGGPPLALTLKR